MTIFGRADPDPSDSLAGEALRRASAWLGAGRVEAIRDGSLLLGVDRPVPGSDSSGARFGGTSDGGVRVAVCGELSIDADSVSACAQGGSDPPPANDADLAAMLYRRDAARFPARLEGAFRLALWDRTARRLLLACDRSAGMRPIYYCRAGAALLFGSSVKALFVQPDAPRAVNPAVLGELFHLGYVTAPDTLFRGIGVLAGGECLEWRDGRVTVTRYARRRVRPLRGLSREETRRVYLDGLDRAVTRATAGLSRPPLVLLSGGVDSAGLVALLRRQGHERVATVSLHLGDPRRNERDMSRRVAAICRTEHTEIADPGAECLDLLPDIIWHQEAPGTESYPTFWLGREARRLAPAALAGTGNDLIWGRDFGRNPLGPMARAVPGFTECRFLSMRRRVERRLIGRLLRVGRGAGGGALRRKLSRRYEPSGSLFQDMVFLEGAAYGSDFVERDLGKLMTDASGLGIRLPYADPELDALVDALPRRDKFAPGRQGGETKVLFKDVLDEQGLLPPEIVRQPKRWMHAPTDDWLRTEWRGPAERLLLGGEARGGPYFDRACVRRLWEEHRDRVGNHVVPLMLLLTFEIWHRLFLEAPFPFNPGMPLSEFARPGGRA